MRTGLAVLSLAAICLGGVLAAQAGGDPLHRFGRKQNVDLRGMKVYDSTGVLQLGNNCASTHAGNTNDTVVCGKFEVPSAAGPSYFDSVGLFSVDPNIPSGRLHEAMLAHKTGADWNVTTKTTLFTCPSTASKCYVTRAILKNGSGTSGTAACGLGFDASGINVHASATHALTNATYMILNPVAVATFGNPNDILGWKCATPEGAAYTSDIDVWGFVDY